MSSPIRLAVVAPAPAFRAGLRALLGVALPGDAPLEVVCESASLAGLDTLTGLDVLLVAADALSGADLEPAAFSTEEQVALLLLTDEPQDARLFSGLPLRSWGVLSLETTPEELHAAVRALSLGLLVGAPALLGSLLSRGSHLPDSDPQAPAEPLTGREAQVLGLLAQGLPNKQIALALGISEHTVKFHISSIYAKLGVTNRTEAARLGVQRGLVSL